MKKAQCFIIVFIFANFAIYGKNIINIKLKIDSHFPKDNSEDIYLAEPSSIAVDSVNNFLVIADQKQNCLFLFDNYGKFIRKIGRGGSGPGDLSAPNFIHVFQKNKLAVYEAANSRIQLFNMEGSSINMIRMFKAYKNFFINNDKLFAAPYLRGDNKDKLVDILNLKGEVEYSFGDPIKFDALAGILNMAGVCRYSDESMLVVFNFLPIIRKYNLNGKMLFEKRVTDEMYLGYEKNNLSNISRSQKNEKVSYKPIFNIAKCFENNLYTIRKNGKKIEIVEINGEGNVHNIYYYENEENPLISDISVSRRSGELIFYLLEISPDANVQILKSENN